jgi:recombinational DNA repair ATPase RecF
VTFHIAAIRVQGFRGICPQIVLNLDGKNLILYGDSGSGKSSFIDAVEYALSGRVTRLEESGQRVSLSRHAKNIRATDMMVEVTLSDGCAQIAVNPNDSLMTTDQNAARYLEQCCKGTFILRRQKLTAFIEAVDKDRYLSLREFLDLQEFENFEASLKQRRDIAKTAAERKATELQMAEKSLMGSCGLSGSDYSETLLIATINESLALLGIQAASSMSDLPGIQKVLDQTIESIGETEQLLALHDAETKTIQFFDSLPGREEASALADKIKALEEIESELGASFREKVLLEGKQWIIEDDLEDCPLCESVIEDRKNLLERIDRRLQENSRLLETREAYKVAKSAVLVKMRACGETQIQLISSLEAVDINAEDIPRLPDILASIKVLTAHLEEKENQTAAVLLTTIDEYMEHDSQSCKATALKWIHNRIKDLPDLEQAKALVAAHELCMKLIREFGQINVLRQLATKLNEVAAILSALLEHAIESRKKACTKIFSEISEVVSDLYSRIHPGEELGDFCFEVKERGEGSIILRGKFFEKENEDPRGFYSEAHLDSLGLAIFLALRKREFRANPDMNLIVLDDVLTSVDAPHRERVANLIMTEFCDQFQVIITTHNRQWFEWLMQLQRSQHSPDRWVNKRILDWSVDHGPVLMDMQNDFDYIRTHRDDTPHEHIAPIAGRLLEHLLQRERYLLGLSLRAKPDDRYTIGDIWPAFLSAVKKRYKGLWDGISTICEDLDNTTVIRNWTTHSIDWASDLSRQEALEFIDGVLSLYEKLYCTTCGHFVEESSAPRGAAACARGCLVYLPPSPS